MTIIEKIKLLFKIAKPAQQVAGEVKKIKAGYKTVTFWISLVGSLLALAGAASGFIPATVSLIITTILTAIYNILRSLDQATQPGVDPIFQSTRFWIGMLGQFSAALLALQSGGISAPWIVTAQSILAAIMAAAQGVGANQPIATTQPTDPNKLS